MSIDEKEGTKEKEGITEGTTPSTKRNVRCARTFCVDRARSLPYPLFISFASKIISSFLSFSLFSILVLRFRKFLFCLFFYYVVLLLSSSLCLAFLVVISSFPFLLLLLLPLLLLSTLSSAVFSIFFVCAGLSLTCSLERL